MNIHPSLTRMPLFLALFLPFLSPMLKAQEISGWTAAGGTSSLGGD